MIFGLYNILFFLQKLFSEVDDRLRFFRRVRFESREGAMIGFEYERLHRICSNCCRINHDVDHCPYLAPQGNDNNEAAHAVDDEADVLMVPVWEEAEGSNNPTPPPPVNHSSSSDLSSHRPISQPPTPASPVFDLNEPAVAHPQSCIPTLSPKSLSHDSTTPSALNVTDRYQTGESSKRRKGKQIALTPAKKKKQYRKDYGVRFYSDSDHTP